jgi:hypothetical protein
MHSSGTRTQTAISKNYLSLFSMKKALTVVALLALPFAASAQTFATNGGLANYINSIINFVNSYVIPLIIAAAIVVLIWGIFKFFVLGGADEEARAKGQSLMIWGVLGLVFILSIYGIVNLVANTIGLNQTGQTITPPQVPTVGGIR